MKTLKIMTGIPRCGKTTWINENKTTEVILSADELRLLIYGQRYWHDGEPQVWATRGVMLKMLLQQGVDIIIDETNTIADRRRNIIKLAKQYGYTITAVVINSDINTCIERAKLTNQEDLVPAIQRMSNQLELPTIEEGFDNIIIV